MRKETTTAQPMASFSQGELDVLLGEGRHANPLAPASYLDLRWVAAGSSEPKTGLGHQHIIQCILRRLSTRPHTEPTDGSAPSPTPPINTQDQVVGGLCRRRPGLTLSSASSSSPPRCDLRVLPLLPAPAHTRARLRVYRRRAGRASSAAAPVTNVACRLAMYVNTFLRIEPACPPSLLPVSSL